MDEFMEKFSIIFFVAMIGLALGYNIAKNFQKIAEDKGYSDSGRFFWWTFFVFPAGAAMVIALPDLKLRNKIETITSTNFSQHKPYKVDDVSDELPDL